MIYEVLQVTAGLSLAVALGLYLYLVATAHVAYVSFRKKSKGLPMLPERRLVGNHLLSWVIGKNPCTRLSRAHKELGKTLGMLYNHRYAVSTTDLDLLKLINHDESGKHINRIKIGIPAEEIEESMMLAKGDHWRKLRRAFAPALKSNKFKHPNVINEIEGSINKLVDMIDSKLNEQASAAKVGFKFQMDELLHRYSLDLVFSCLYKQRDQINFDDNECHWTKLTDEGLFAFQTSWAFHAAMMIPFLKPLIDWLIYNFHSQGASRKSLLQFVKMQTKLGLEARKHAERLKSARKAGEHIDMDNFVLEDGTKFSRNMIDHVVDQFLDGKLTKDEYFNTSCFLVGAADKTAADCLVNTLYQVAVNEDIQMRLRKSILKDGIDSEYLDWVLKESLRLAPPASVGCSRTVTRDIELQDGYVVPNDTFVVANAFVIHRLEKYWGEDAEEFKPERWADTSNHHPMQYIPFGAGLRGCPGKEFALFEMKMLLTTLLTRYKFQCSKKDDLYVFDSPCFVFLIPNSHTWITIKRL